MLIRYVRTRFVVVLIALAAVGLATIPAPAGPLTTVVVAQGSRYYPGDKYFPQPTLYVAQGSSLLMTNLDTAIVGAHTMTSDLCVSNGEITEVCEINDAHLFASDLIPSLGRGEVHGVESIAPGTYTFYCDKHGHGMSGTLVVI